MEAFQVDRRYRQHVDTEKREEPENQIVYVVMGDVES